MKKIILALVCLCVVESLFACINEYRTLLNGEVVYADASSGKVWAPEIDTIALQRKSEELLAAYQRTGSLEYYSDYAAALTYLGNYQKAKAIYHEIEERSPDLYTTASNLGTIYELIGKPDSALIWITKSVKINPDSHGGSEWIHIKILEYKLSKSQDIRASILGLDFGNTEIPANPHKYNLDKLSREIYHQLEERITFVKPPNEIVGNIYFDLGNLFAQTRTVQTALDSYKEAQKYGFESALLTKRIEEMERLALKAKPSQFKEDLKDFIRDHFKMLFWSGLLGMIALGALVLRFIKRRK